MKLSRLLKESALFWPSSIDISDCVIGSGGAVRFPLMAHIQGEVEERQVVINEWHELINWSVYVGYHEAARRKLELGSGLIVQFKEISQNVVGKHIFETLHSKDSSWPRHLKRKIQLNS